MLADVLIVHPPDGSGQGEDLRRRQRRDHGPYLDATAVLADQSRHGQLAEACGAAEGAVARRRGGESEQICDRSRAEHCRPERAYVRAGDREPWFGADPNPGRDYGTRPHRAA